MGEGDATLFSKAAMAVAVINIVGGMLFGYNIGFVPIYSTFNTINANCSGFVTADACNSVVHTNCVWLTLDVNRGECVFGPLESGPVVQCKLLTVEATCNTQIDCHWDAGVCENNAGWDAVKTGIFAGAMIVGATIGAFGCPPLMERVGQKKTVLLQGIIGVVGSVLCSIARAADTYGLLIVGRVIVGLACGGSTVVCPAYVADWAPKAIAEPLGCMYQIACTFGIMFVALVGVIAQPTAPFNTSMHMEARLQAVCIISTFISLLSILASVFVMKPDKSALLEEVIAAEDREKRPMINNTDGPSPAVSPAASPSTTAKPRPGYVHSGGDVSLPHEYRNVCDTKFALFVAWVVTVGFQLTGINAIMNYAPQITKAAGFQPLVGNFIVMLWNFLTTMASIPAAKRFSLRKMFLTGTAVASSACLVVGIIIYPGVTTNMAAQHVLVGLAILIFIAAFEVGMGPPFYLLARDLFPEGKVRAQGASFTLASNFVFNIIINVVFPVAVVAISGGASGDQNKGMSVVFFFFAAVGTVCTGFFWKFLHPFGSG